MLCVCHDNHNDCTTHSEMNEAEEPESNSTLASTVEPSGALTVTTHVISNTLDGEPIVA